MLFELKTDLEQYLATWAPGAVVKTLADVVAFNQQHRAEELTFFGQEYFERAVKKGPLTDLAYLAARDKVNNFPVGTWRRCSPSRSLTRSWS